MDVRPGLSAFPKSLLNSSEEQWSIGGDDVEPEILAAYRYTAWEVCLDSSLRRCREARELREDSGCGSRRRTLT